LLTSLFVTNLDNAQPLITDGALQNLTKLRRLWIPLSQITTCEPFAETLIELLCTGNNMITNIGLQSCTKLQILYADNCPNITTCVPFAHTLTKLSISGTCGINDDGIIMCTKLITLLCYRKDNVSEITRIDNSIYTLTKLCIYNDTHDVLRKRIKGKNPRCTIVMYNYNCLYKTWRYGKKHINSICVE